MYRATEQAPLGIVLWIKPLLHDRSETLSVRDAAAEEQQRGCPTFIAVARKAGDTGQHSTGSQHHTLDYSAYRQLHGKPKALGLCSMASERRLAGLRH